VIGSAARTLIHDLGGSSGQSEAYKEKKSKIEERDPTIAVIAFPSGPVTEIQAPHSAASSQFESDNAVPKREEGSV